MSRHFVVSPQSGDFDLLQSREAAIRTALMADATAIDSEMPNADHIQAMCRRDHFAHLSKCDGGEPCEYRLFFQIPLQVRSQLVGRFVTADVGLSRDISSRSNRDRLERGAEGRA